jgi:fatty acid desaturase
MKVLKTYRDIGMLVFLLLIVAVRLGFWWYSPGSFFVWLPILTGITFILYSIKHNLIHVALFHSTFLNRIFDYIVGVFTGTSSHGVYVVHIVNHHKENNKKGDWGCTERYHNDFEVVNFLIYIFSTPLIFLREKRQWLKKNSLSAIAKKSTYESWLILLTYVLMIIFRFESTILYIILPNTLVQLVLVSFNFFQHRQCDPNSKYNHSRNFTGKLLNLVTFNNGYHTAHHLYPSAHWSEYKEIHSNINQQIDDKYIESNILVYFFNLVFTRNAKTADISNIENIINPLNQKFDRHA